MKEVVDVRTVVLDLGARIRRAVYHDTLEFRARNSATRTQWRVVENTAYINVLLGHPERSFNLNFGIVLDEPELLA